jgi:hypothetical protein
MLLDFAGGVESAIGRNPEPDQLCKANGCGVRYIEADRKNSTQ